MPRRIGDLLTESGLVTRDQLDSALRAQLFSGGHLGTCLMELGMIDEDSLGDALARLFRVPYAPARVLKNLSSKTLRALPLRLAEKHRAIPISVDEGGLHLAMVDPRNVQSIDEIAFMTGYRVKPWVSPEARILQALDRYYGVRRSIRYINLGRSLEATQSLRESSETRRASSVGTPQPSVARPDEDRAVASLNPEEFPDLGGEFGYGRSWKDIAVDIGLDGPRPGTEPYPLHPPRGRTVRPTIREATDKLCRADRKQDAVDALLEFASARMERAIFLGVNDGVASVWDARGAELDRRRTSPTTFSVDSEPLFALLLGDDYHRGPLPPGRPFAGFYETLGMEEPIEILLVPIYFDDHLVAFFYGDGGPGGTVTGETDEYLRLFRMFPMAVQQVVLKESMRAIGSVYPEAEKSSSK